jgi:hypothetical protein
MPLRTSGAQQCAASEPTAWYALSANADAAKRYATPTGVLATSVLKANWLAGIGRLMK